MNRSVWWMALCLLACGDPPVDPAGDATTVDAAPVDANAVDGSSVDASPLDGSSDTGVAPSDTGTMTPDAATCGALPSVPTAALRPQAGELFYAQLGLGGFSIGESAVLVGPDGTVVLIDVGNDSHDDDVERALNELLSSTDVDHVVITHFHADHGDGLEGVLGRVTLSGHIVYRGFTDLTAAANDATIDSICGAIAAHPGSDAPLCEAATRAPCSVGARTGTYPATGCAGLATADIALGSGALMDFVAANGVLGDARYETTVGPIRTRDSNGENARSVVAVVSHGAFRMLLAGDLTGGGSDTDDLESFYASRLSMISALGVDVLHAGHHGRNTSSNATWAARLLPADGLSRNVVMGISTAHINSPHAVVLTTLLGGDRLAEGRAWATTVAPGGATSPDLVDARGGRILIATLEGGASYAVQAVSGSGAVIETRVFRSVGACP